MKLSQQTELPQLYSTAELYLGMAWGICVLIVWNIRIIAFSDKVAPSLEGLEPGWIPGRQMDLYDAQWSSFRSSLPLLTVFAISHIAIVNFARSVSVRANLLTNLVLGVIYSFVLFGYNAIFLLILAYGNFLITKLLAHNNRGQVAATWAYNVLTLILVSGWGDQWRIFPAEWEVYSGMVSWHNRYNMFILKMISFVIDFSRRKEEAVPANKQPAQISSADYKTRQSTSHPTGEYSLVHYFAYLFYVPLVVAGPHAAFNAWWSQIKAAQTTLNGKAIWRYAIFRFFAIFLLMEVFLQFVYTNAIAANKDVSSTILSELDSVTSGIWLSICVLFFMWMKFLLIWRFFRLWSLGCGIETPENMNRCVFNNYSVGQFWKSWHSSFNVWIVRYLFVPLGGSKKNKFLNIVIVFLFVALWHDLDWRLLHWAVFISLMFVPELVGVYVFNQTAFFKRLKITHPFLCKHIAIFASMMGTFLLISANLVGYVFGLDGLATLIKVLFNTFTVTEGFVLFATFYVGANLMRYSDQKEAKGKEKRLVIELGVPRE